VIGTALCWPDFLIAVRSWPATHRRRVSRRGVFMSGAHIVEPEDALGGIAKQYGIELDA
jgi:hypothetical protein